MEGTGILAAGVVCPAGKTRSAATAALRMNERFLRQDRGLVGPDGFAITVATVIPLAEERDYFFRLYYLFEDAFVDCVNQLSDSGISGKGHLTLFLPEIVRISDAEAWFEEKILDRIGKYGSAVSFDYGGSAAEISALQNGGSGLSYVAAVDSLISAELIDRLIMAKRLQTTGNPWGIIPGEGAAVLALGVGSETSAQVLSVAMATETARSDDPDRGIMGRALASAMRQAVGSAVPAHLFADLDGSREAIEEFGLAVTANGRSVSALADKVQALMPQIGHPGVAAGLLLVALSMDGEGPVLVCANSSGGLRCCALIGSQGYAG